MQIEFLNSLYQEAVVFQSYKVQNLKDIQNKRPSDPCPYFLEPQKPNSDYRDSNHKVIPENEIYIRKPLIPLGRFYPTYLIWVEDTTEILKIFDKTVLNCQQKIDTGIYNPQSKFLFVANQNEKDLKKIFSQNKYLTRHRYVAILQSLPFGTDQKFKVYGNDILNQDDGKGMILNHLWSGSTPFKVLDDAFTPLTNFDGMFFH